LKAVSLVIKNEVVQPVLAFVEQNIQNQDWKLRYAALLSLGAITEGPDRQKFIELITPALETILRLFRDQHGKVREAAGWMISKICEFHAESLLSSMNVLIESCLHGLQDKPRIANQICHCLDHLSKSFAPQDPEQRNNAMTVYFEPVFQRLV